MPPDREGPDPSGPGSENAAPRDEDLEDIIELVMPPTDMPEGHPVELPGRGTTFMRLVNGPPGAPTVVLLHGWTANSALNWYYSYGPLSKHFRVLAIDHRGHGRGMRTPDPFSLQACADDVSALIDVLALEKVIAVGYSMGGLIAQLLWRRHPEQVEGLVLCATAATFIGNSPGERAMQGVVTGLTFAARRAPSSVSKRVAERVLVGKYDDTPVGTWAREEARLNDPRSIVEAGQALSQFSSVEWVGEIDIPAAVVLTRNDHVVAPERQTRLADAIPGTTIHPIHGDHDVCATDPDTFVPALLDACLDVRSRLEPATPSAPSA